MQLIKLATAPPLMEPTDLVPPSSFILLSTVLLDVVVQYS